MPHAGPTQGAERKSPIKCDGAPRTGHHGTWDIAQDAALVRQLRPCFTARCQRVRRAGTDALRAARDEVAQVRDSVADQSRSARPSPPHGRACLGSCPARNAIVVGDPAADGDSGGRDWIDHLGSRPRSPSSPSPRVIVSPAPAGTVVDHWGVTLEEHLRVDEIAAAGDARRLRGSLRRRCGAVGQRALDPEASPRDRRSPSGGPPEVVGYEHK